MRLFVICFFCFTINCNSQTYILKYECFFDTDFPFKMDTYLLVNDEFSCFKVDYSTRKDTGKSNFSEFKRKTVTVQSLNRMDLYYLKRNNSILQYTQLIGREEVLIKDSLPKIDWIITKESRQINDFLAYKATGYFRGREWIVWFTPDLPYSYGPWKLKGLPGLILIAHDSQNIYSYKLTDINTQNDLGLYEEFIEKVENIKKIPLRTYLEEYKKKLENGIQTAAMKSHVTVMNRNNIKIQNSQMELVFEWEEDKK